MGMMASSITQLYHHIAGMASHAATATVHGRSVRAPHTTSRNAAGRRIQSGMGMALGAIGLLDSAMSSSIHSRHIQGASRNDTPAMIAVAPRAMARERHSRRTANQTRPMPGVTLVSSTNDHVQG